MNQYFQNWLKSHNRPPIGSREKFTPKEVKNNYGFQNYLTFIAKPAHRVGMTRLRLGCQALRIVTGKY